MEEITKQWENIGKDNQLIVKKGIVAGLLLYVLLLVVHDLLPYALGFFSVYFVYQWIQKQT